MDINQATAYEQYLPESLRVKAKRIGLAASIKLVDHFGGINQLYIPERMTRDHVIARMIGYEAACILSEDYGGDYIDVPRCVKALRMIRDDEIWQRCKQGGETPRNVCRDYNLTERQVWIIIGRNEPDDDRQAELF